MTVIRPAPNSQANTANMPARSPRGGAGPTSAAPSATSNPIATTSTRINPAMLTKDKLSGRCDPTPRSQSRGTPQNTTAAQIKMKIAPATLANASDRCAIDVLLSSEFLTATAINVPVSLWNQTGELGRGAAEASKPLAPGLSAYPPALIAFNQRIDHVSNPVKQGRSDSNAQPLVLETSALPIELHPFGEC